MVCINHNADPKNNKETEALQVFGLIRLNG